MRQFNVRDNSQCVDNDGDSLGETGFDVVELSGFNGETIATFETEAEADAFIKGAELLRDRAAKAVVSESKIIDSVCRNNRLTPRAHAQIMRASRQAIEDRASQVSHKLETIFQAMEDLADKVELIYE